MIMKWLKSDGQAKCRELTERDPNGQSFVTGTVADPEKPGFIKVQLDSGPTVTTHPTGRMRKEAGNRLVRAGDRVIVCLSQESSSNGFLWAYVSEKNYRVTRKT